MDKSILQSMSYGVYVVTTAFEGKSAGCIINTAVQISAEPPCVSIALNKNNFSLEVAEKSGKFVLGILSESTPPKVITEFGFSSSRDRDKLMGFEQFELGGLPAIDEKCCGALLCKVISRVDAGTHVLLIAEVIETVKLSGEAPMTYSYYHTVIKGKAPKNAPTFVEETKEENKAAEYGKGRYKCDICGYEFEGELTEGYVCPICGADASHFSLVE